MTDPTTTPRSSVQKLDDQLQRLADARPEGAVDRMLMTTVRSLLPTLRKAGYIPTDAAELDQILLAGAQWMLELRSDDASGIVFGYAGEATP